MSTDAWFEKLEEEVFPAIEGLEFEMRKRLDREDIDRLIAGEDSLLTEDTDELRSYGFEYEGHTLAVSVEKGTYEGEEAFGVSGDVYNRLEDEALQGVMNETARVYGADRKMLGHGEYILVPEE